MLKIVTNKIGSKRVIPEGENYVFCTTRIETLYVINSIFQPTHFKGRAGINVRTWNWVLVAVLLPKLIITLHLQPITFEDFNYLTSSYNDTR